MIKAILEFTLPEDRCEHIISVNAMNWALVAWEMNNKLRNISKYGQEEEWNYETVDKIRDLLFEIIDDHGVSLDMIE